MKKIILIICVCILGVPVWSNDSKGFEFFDEYLDYYDTQIQVGKFFTIGGLGVVGVGGAVATLGVSINNATEGGSELGSGLATTGYVFLGIGAVITVIAFPLWIYGLHRYNYILEQRDKYFWMTQ